MGLVLLRTSCLRSGCSDTSSSPISFLTSVKSAALLRLLHFNLSLVLQGLGPHFSYSLWFYKSAASQAFRKVAVSSLVEWSAVFAGWLPTTWPHHQSIASFTFLTIGATPSFFTSSSQVSAQVYTEAFSSPCYGGSVRVSSLHYGILFLQDTQ